MKFTLNNRRKWLIGAGAALLLTATPSFALFGIGDIVFDPTSYASLVSAAHHDPDAVQHAQKQHRRISRSSSSGRRRFTLWKT